MSDVPTAAPVSGESDSGAAGGAAPDFSGTNVQELGVDEPDVLKTDGRRIFVVTDQTLRVVDVASGSVTGGCSAGPRSPASEAHASSRPRTRLPL